MEFVVIHPICYFTTGPKLLPKTVIQCFLCQFPLSSRFCKVIQLLLKSSSFHHLCPSLYISTNNVFQKEVPTQDVANLIILPHFHYTRMQDVTVPLDYMQHFLISDINGPTELLHPSPAPHFKTVQVFMTYFAKFPVSLPYKAMLQMQHLTSFFFKFEPNLLVKRAFFFLFNAAFVVEILDLCHMYILHHYHATQVVEIFHILHLFLS